MPRLSYPKIAIGNAIASLVDLYRNDPGFIEELGMIRLPHMAAIYEYSMNTLDFSNKCKEVLSPQDYSSVARAFQNQGNLTVRLPAKLKKARIKLEQSLEQLGPYIESLDKLALKWKLRAKWVGPILLLYDMFDLYTVFGIMPSGEIEMPIESMGSLYPWPPPMEDLVIRVPPWAFFLLGRAEIEKEISEKVSHYESQLRSKGYHEFPSSLRRHARWWFMHYVKRKKYDEIAALEAQLPDGKAMYERNVGVAVRKFSKLVGINIRE
jgi:hypothetical protein